MPSEPNSCRRSKLWSLAAIVVVFLLVFRLEYWTPMHSDDYFYFLKGVSLHATLSHYLHWSGRLVADFVSSALLGLNSHFLTTAINAASVVALAWAIACMPGCALGRRAADTGFHPTVFLLVFFLYWVANPAIGQTSLWIVGSANYLWTNLLLCLFLLGFLRELRSIADDAEQGKEKGQRQELERGRAWPRLAGLCVLGLAAGCSNENTSLTALVLTAFLAWRPWRERRDARLWWLVLAFAAGAAVLLLAPGNFERYQSMGYHEWRHMGLAIRSWDHLYRRFPNAMVQYWEAFLVLILLIGIGPRCGRDVRRYVALFVAASFVANLVLLPAPHIPKRAMNGGLVFLLIAVSFAAYGFLAKMDGPGAWRTANPRRAPWLPAVLTLVCGLHFALIYGFMYYSYQATYIQAQVRDAIIRRGIGDGQSHIEIPDFYFPALLRERHRFDRFFNGRAMAHYYGTQATITQYKVRNPYSFSVPPVRR
ncbi:DUF6056 family protein [Candidimonas nitroreducens]|uniref:Glycosyltransferase RgtA/B/C/D-like domain-containing protein n=1 Tax=Candidimonas nitroreducens TaxID=683354 RepID=A0A225MW95_9BURK|nr:DUF6056 family protein [Candidimonas nitroreducens]OWT63851.1 hypothetical protein CEY11_05965 [Candidimonas nitroreducens]